MYMAHLESQIRRYMMHDCYNLNLVVLVVYTCNYTAMSDDLLWPKVLRHAGANTNIAVAKPCYFVRNTVRQ
jgi:hypothetical protein